jgi:hypothetical protein
MDFDIAFTRLLGSEGGYVNDPRDPGGETNWGVTKRVAVACGFTRDMRTMTQADAKCIYKLMFWDAVRGDDLGELAFHVFDAAVNSGVPQAVKWLQEALGVKADGVIGPATLAAVQAADTARLVRVFTGQRLDFLTDRITWPSFGRGWAKRIANNLRI